MTQNSGINFHFDSSKASTGTIVGVVIAMLFVFAICGFLAYTSVSLILEALAMFHAANNPWGVFAVGLFWAWVLKTFFAGKIDYTQK